jgi:hypothetical protein
MREAAALILYGRIRHVLAHHRPAKGRTVDFCPICMDGDGGLTEWPCPTVRMLDGDE